MTILPRNPLDSFNEQTDSSAKNRYITFRCIFFLSVQDAVLTGEFSVSEQKISAVLVSVGAHSNIVGAGQQTVWSLLSGMLNKSLAL